MVMVTGYNLLEGSSHGEGNLRTDGQQANRDVGKDKTIVRSVQLSRRTKTVMPKDMGCGPQKQRVMEEGNEVNKFVLLEPVLGMPALRQRLKSVVNARFIVAGPIDFVFDFNGRQSCK